MTDPSTAEPDTTPKTAADLALEKMNARFAELESQLLDELKEAREANRQLWAELHPATSVQDPPAVASPDEPSGQDIAMAAFREAFGAPKE